MKLQKWIDTFKDKQGKKISRILFKSYSTQEEITKQFNSEAYNRWLKRKDKKKTEHYVLPIVQHYFKEWEENGFIEKSKPLREVNSAFLPEEYKNKVRFLSKKFALSILNLNPLFRYCEEKNIIFTKEEKNCILFSFDFKDNRIREAILEEFPEEDIINAFLKFYVENTILKYALLLKDIREDKILGGKKYKKYEDKAEIKNNPKKKADKKIKKMHDKFIRDLNKKYGVKEKEVEWDTFRTYIYDMGFTNYASYVEARQKEIIPVKDYLFRSYITQREHKPKLFDSIDNKMLSALGILPS